MTPDHDFHIHTRLSICADKTASVSNYVKKAMELKLSKIGISNHLWDQNIEQTGNPKGIEFYKPQTFEPIFKEKDEFDNVKGQDIKIYLGAEVEYSEKNGIAITEENAKRLDYLLAAHSHAHLMMPRSDFDSLEKRAEFMLNSFYKILDCELANYITAIAHPFYCGGSFTQQQEIYRRISIEQYEQCFQGARDKNIAIELNASAFKNLSPSQIKGHEGLKMLEIAKRCGCKFIIGSDAHSMAGYEHFSVVSILINILKIDRKDLCEL